jgi:hypothetical protein
MFLISYVAALPKMISCIMGMMKMMGSIALLRLSCNNSFRTTKNILFISL